MSIAQPPATERPSVSALVVLLRLLSNAGDTPARYGALPLAATLLSTPFLLQVWLRATLVPDRLHEHGRAASARYRAALAIHAGYLAYTAAWLLVAQRAGTGAYRALSLTHDERLQTLGALLVCALPLSAALHATTWFDAAQALLAGNAANLRAALQGGLQRTSFRLCVTHGAFGLGSVSLIGFGMILPRIAFGISGTATLATFIATQLLALCVSLLRGVWLAWLVDDLELADLDLNPQGLTQPKVRL